MLYESRRLDSMEGCGLRVTSRCAGSHCVRLPPRAVSRVAHLYEIGRRIMPETLATEATTTGKNSAETPSAKKKAFNSFQIAQAQFDKVAEYLGLDPATRDLL